MNYSTTQGQIFNQTSTLPFLQTGTACITIPSTVWTPSDRNNLPRPPISMRGRPLSAGSARRVQTMGAPPIPSPAPSMQQSKKKNDLLTVYKKCYQNKHKWVIFYHFTGVRNGWVNGMAGRQQVNQNVDINKVQEKVSILFMTFLLLLLSNTHIVVVLLESVGVFLLYLKLYYTRCSVYYLWCIYHFELIY